MRPKGYKQSRGHRQAISQGMQAYHARVHEAMAQYLSLKESIGLKGSPRVTKTPGFLGELGAVAIIVMVIGSVAAAMLIAAREPSPADIATRRPKDGTAEQGAAPATRVAAEVTPARAPHESAADAPVQTSVTLTMTGCLERHDETFQLKDTTGLDAPRSRNWKSGFLKKRSVSIGVVAAANRLKLTDHVGQRVSVTGVLVDREIQVRSLQRVAASCS
jgi:hypothetical protein